MKLIIKNDVRELTRVKDMVDSIGADAAIDDMEVSRLNLVMEEAVSNVILYAFPRTEEHSIEISADLDETKMLTLTISDDGMEFDPTARKDADITLPAEDRPIGGLGIYIVKQYMDLVAHERNNGRNVLTLKKLLK